MNDQPGIIDTDVHNTYAHPKDLLPYVPKAFHKHWLGMGGNVGGGGGYYVPKSARPVEVKTESGDSPRSDPAYLKEHYLDKYGIDYAILTGPSILGISLNPDPDYGTIAASAYNDWLVETWLKVSPQYKGSIVINHSEPLAAAKEIDRMAKHPDMVQVIMSSGSRMLFGQRCYHPIYEAAARNGLPVAIYPGTEGRGISGPATPSGHPASYWEWLNILPTNYMAHINSLVCEGVFEKFPQLKFIAIEGGLSWLPHLMWRMDKNYKGLRDQVPWLKRLPSEYIKEHIRLTTQPIEEPEQPEHLHQILDMLGADQMVMFSGAYPHGDVTSTVASLQPIREELRQKILAGNAMELYGLYKKPLAAVGANQR